MLKAGLIMSQPRGSPISCGLARPRSLERIWGQIFCFGNGVIGSIEAERRKPRRME